MYNLTKYKILNVNKEIKIFKYLNKYLIWCCVLPVAKSTLGQRADV